MRKACVRPAKTTSQKQAGKKSFDLGAAPERDGGFELERAAALQNARAGRHRVQQGRLSAPGINGCVRPD